jgi:alkylation response protein AidB-like acyl-CoA dehydrogenase
MKLTFTPELEAFRAEFDAWLDEHCPTPEEAVIRSTSSADVPQWARAFQRKMFDAGWLLPGQPPEFGGRNASLMEQFIVEQELGKRQIYRSFNPQGLSIIAPSIILFGTDDQKEKWARRVLRAEITAALGMSEPGAGSDLAALRTRADVVDGGFIVNGQKVWTSGAHHADFIHTFVRTDQSAPKHRGISCLIIPTDSPGVTRRPFGSVCSPDDRDFNEVFFDDVFVPMENLVGGLNDGWRVATGTLGEERAMLWSSQSDRLEELVDNFANEIRGTDLADDPIVHDWFGKLVIDANALQLLGLRTLARMSRGRDSAEQSILKLMGSEAAQNAANEALEALGPRALDVTRVSAPFNHLNYEHFNVGWFDRYARSFSGTIAGGTSEIQRNIIAEHVLGLPRS